MKQLVLSVFMASAALSGVMIAPFGLEARTVTDQVSTLDAVQKSQNEDVLWLARVINSETDRPEEQVMIAWVVRNRVDTGFRGSTYKQVALSAHQFSGLNPSDRKYGYNISRSFDHDEESWNKAIEIAEAVYGADEVLRPFPVTVRHFYSPMAVGAPSWAMGTEPLFSIRDPKNGAERFAFYDGVE